MDFNTRKYCEERGVVFASDEPQTAAKSNNGDGELPPAATQTPPVVAT